MADADVDRNLLFGILALQNHLIDQGTLFGAFHAWSAHRAKSLDQLLLDRGALGRAEHALVLALAEKHLKQHGGNPRATLDAVADPAVRKSFGARAPAGSYVLVETLLKPTEQRSRYTLNRIHAEGGLGKVWIARDTDLNREVALKEIQPTQANHPEMWRRFLREAQITGQLEHPNIVPVYELARRPEDGQPFYTMRFVRGRTLREAIAAYHHQRLAGTPDRVELRTLLGAFVSVCQAIAYAHSRGVIHRDLKPENVALGSFGEVVVLDWGLARTIDRDEDETALSVALSDDAQAGATGPGRQLGTPAYMAPEQAEGRLDLVDERTDVYGLGAILFELLAGHPPHEGKDTAEVLHRVVQGETPRARSAGLFVPIALDAVCARAMAKARTDRYATASELARDVERWLADEPVSALGERWTRRVARWSRRHRSWVQAGAASLALIALISFGFAVRKARDAEQIRREQGKVLQALTQAKSEQDEKQKALERALLENRRAGQSLSDFSLERGRTLLERNDLAGLFWMIGALEQAPGDDEARQVRGRLNLAYWMHQTPSVKAFLPSLDSVSAVAFSPDGSTVVTGSFDSTARLWSACDGTPIGSPMKHDGPVSVLAFSPDGTTVLTGSHFDKTARLWSAHDGAPLGKLALHQGGVSALAFSPDGKTIATGSDDKTARLWRARDGAPLGPPLTHQGGIHTLAFSPDGRMVVTGSADFSARLWRADSGSPVGSPLMHQGGVNAAAFSPDGQTIVTGSDDNTARFWRVADGAPVGSPLTHEGPVSGIAFSPDGKTLVTGSLDSTARLWRTSDGVAIGAPLTHAGPVSALAFSPDGKAILTGSLFGKTARLWRTRDGAPVGQPMTHQGGVSALAFSPDGRTIVTGSDDEMARLWGSCNGTRLGPPLMHAGPVNALAFSPDGKTIATGSTDRSARLWRACDGTPIGSPMSHEGPVSALAFSPDGRTVLTGSHFGRAARLWSARDGTPIGPPLMHHGEVRTLAFSPDGKTIATGSADNTARLWSAHHGTPLGRVITHLGPVSTLAFSPNGETVVTGSHDNTARLWSARDGTPLGRPMTHQGGVSALAFSPDGKTVVTGSHDSTAQLWSAAAGAPLGPPMLHEGPVNALAFSPDGTLIATASEDKTARLWSVTDGRPLGPPLTHQASVTALAFSPDGKTIVTGSADLTARFWSASDGSPIGRPLNRRGPINALAFSPDGQTVVTGSDDKTARLWRVPRPLSGSPRRIALWVEVATGLTSSGETKRVRPLSPQEWAARRRALDAPDGPPRRTVSERGSRGKMVARPSRTSTREYPDVPSPLPDLPGSAPDDVRLAE